MIEALKSILFRIIGIILLLGYIYEGIKAAHRFRKEGYFDGKYFLALSPVMLVYAIVYWSFYIVAKVIAAFRNKRN